MSFLSKISKNAWLLRKLRIPNLSALQNFRIFINDIELQALTTKQIDNAKGKSLWLLHDLIS